MSIEVSPQIIFQSTSPVWRTTSRIMLYCLADLFQSTSPVWRTTQSYCPHMGRGAISIHVPRVEDDAEAFLHTAKRSVFQSTSPVWRTTSWDTAMSLLMRIFQSTSPVWRTTSSKKSTGNEKGISIHVPRVEDDHNAPSRSGMTSRFQSTSPVWRTTC